ncbi:aminoglycoside phosphotransferase family protein [Streptosporangium sp. NPDC000239]|uniref:phosphotransferase family protein n=1 Tax=Streptosporangium sp. NPDC000239 TaxID=3154248 RepID=UPI0033302450
MSQTDTVEQASLNALRSTCRQAGIDARDAEPIRFSENAIYRLPYGVVARVSRVGQLPAAAKEVQVARWLEGAGVPAVRTLPDVEQPVEAEGRAVTFWRELPPHRPGTAADVAALLRKLHGLPPPEHFTLPALDPFVRLTDRIDQARMYTAEERQWLRERLADLERGYAALPSGLPACVVHGDAWIGNVLVTEDGRAVLADFERSAFGPPEWDLVSMAVKYATLGGISKEDYAAFIEVYGYDVMTWEGYQVLRDIRELRLVTMAAQVGMEDDGVRGEAAVRLAAIRGESGPRPWHWKAVSR